MDNPSLVYLHSLSNGNESFKNRIIQLFIEELPEELSLYEKALSSKNLFWASEIVHKIKHKIAFLQMEESLEVSEKHELALREGKLKYQREFLDIISKILKFLTDCKD
ncbi:Hpt domain-containing protein [Algoriphagus aestuarii]|nr:Hpt domain-containing protein [Algoriphagus aestuarii]